MLKITKTNGKVHVEKKPKNSARERVLRRQLLQRLKTQCVFCGNNEPLVLELHHIEAKEYAIGEALTWEDRQTFFLEVIKCVPMCANCHKLVHADKLPQLTAPLYALDGLEKEWETLDDI